MTVSHDKEGKLKLFTTFLVSRISRKIEHIFFLDHFKFFVKIEIFKHDFI